MHVAHLSVTQLLICCGLIDSILGKVTANRCVTLNAVLTIMFEAHLGTKNINIVKLSVELSIGGVANLVLLASVPSSEVVMVSVCWWIEGFMEQLISDVQWQIVRDSIMARLQPHEHIRLCHNGSIVHDEAVVVGAVQVLASEWLIVGTGHVCCWHQQELIECQVSIVSGKYVDDSI